VWREEGEEGEAGEVFGKEGDGEVMEMEKKEKVGEMLPRNLP